MLRLVNITKDYVVGGNVISALRGVSLEFRRNEFVSILGPSGCGKTTLLNIIGGLDKYTSGDLLIDEKTTKQFKDSEWDAYRNNTIGMVFQNYNLIAHLSVLDNVSIALTLSGVGLSERKERAKKALIEVGLEDQIGKKPNQLSGGQMQRVAIARALVNNPDILLADEPTGALDTTTSVQILELLKQISKSRLVIMVTHNEELADAYSDRIIKLVDGLVRNDSNSYENGVENTSTLEKLKNKKTSMSFLTAIKHSFKNLMTKKKRTTITSIAGSIGIIGVALVLAISNGMSQYVSQMQTDMLAGFPITVSKTAMVMMMRPDMGGGNEQFTEYPEGSNLYSYDSEANASAHINNITDNYISYLNQMDSSLYNSISYSYGIEMNVLTKTDSGGYNKVNTTASGGIMGMGGGALYFKELPDNREFVESQYDLLGENSRYPENANEIVLIVDSYNRIDVKILNEFGVNISDNYTINDMIGRILKVVHNDDYYHENGGVYSARSDLESLYNETGNTTLTIVGILRVKESATTELLSSGIYYTNQLTQVMLTSAGASNVVQAQEGNTTNVLTGQPFNNQVTYESVMLKIGAETTPIGIQIYPVDFEAKEKIKQHMDAYNAGRVDEEKIIYTDLAETISSMTSTLINTITIVLTAFAAISLVVSSIMIGIITYVSVVERTKEIGILRAIGARKKDISRLFNAETIIIGFTAGLIGILITLLLSIPINALVNNLIGVEGIATLSVWHGLLLIGISMVLTFIGGLIPSRIAAKQDPVVALRTE